MSFKVGEKIYEGKAKIVFSVVDEPDLVYQEFKDSLTALNGGKKGSFPEKGQLNRDITSMIFQKLSLRGVSNHWVENQGATGMFTKKVQIFPVEVVVRNVVAGSLAKRLGWEEGRKLPQSLVEYYYKNDELGDPLINEDHIKVLGLCTDTALADIRRKALVVNSELTRLFGEADLNLIDFKLEFGRSSKGEILLADEISPDTCRLWDKKTDEKLDKDRFRRDLGSVKEAYLNVRSRIEATLKKSK